MELPLTSILFRTKVPRCPSHSLKIKI